MLHNGVMGNDLCLLLIPLIVGLAAMAVAVMPDIFQFIFRQMHLAFFLVMLAFAVLSITVTSVDISSIKRASHDPVSSISSLWETQESIDRKVKMAITRCQSFVAEELAQPGSFSKEETGVIKASFKKETMWEYCAEQFGVNYWKYDTTIDGRRGGDVLCEAYANSGYNSSEVDTWCSTVFASRD